MKLTRNRDPQGRLMRTFGVGMFGSPTTPPLDGHDILTITDNSARAQVTTAAAHGLDQTAEITLSETVDYNGAQTVFTVDSATIFTIAAAYTNDNTGGRWD